jgi:threonine dehydrogenase-like Zn-dependent dehydrogenase
VAGAVFHTPSRLTEAVSASRDLSAASVAWARLRCHKIDPKLLITHRFKLDRILDAYETFGHAAKTKALKVIIET